MAATRSSRVLARGLFLIVCFRSLLRYSSGLCSGAYGREIKDLDLDLVARQPILNRLGVMDAQIVDDQKDLLLRVLDETLHEVDEDRDVQRTLVEIEPHEAAIVHGGDHARRELLSGLRQDRRLSFGA